MTKFKFVIIALFAIGLTFTSCGNKSAQKEQSETQSKEYSSAYVCPMHCKGSGSSKEGNCPVCGMEYKVNKNHNTKGHKH